VSSAHADTAVGLVSRVDAALHGFVDPRFAALEALDPELTVVAAAARDLLFGGGKRIRPQFAYWGWRSVRPAGAGGEAEALDAAASLELLHVAALVHDDLIDASAIRRGQPAAHARFARHAADEGVASPGADGFGSAAAILLGDQLLSWAWAMLADAAVSAEASALFATTAQEMMAGQFLDVLAQVRGGHSVEAALRVARFKSGKYTVERPLQFGAAVGGAPAETLDRLAAFGLPLGEAFQLRDDLLGVFGDPALTGKPAGDDLREGKRTVLVALAHDAARPTARAELDAGLGDPELDAARVQRLCDVITGTGAAAEVERMITVRAQEALAALESAVIRPDAKAALRALALKVVDRSS
jgi:geranylgeranyl diphosphate synthase, type I